MSLRFCGCVRDERESSCQVDSSVRSVVGLDTHDTEAYG